MRISDWSSDVCSSDLHETGQPEIAVPEQLRIDHRIVVVKLPHHEREQRDDRDRRGGDDQPTGEPALALTAIHRDLEETQPQEDQEHAEIIDPESAHEQGRAGPTEERKSTRLNSSPKSASRLRSPPINKKHATRQNIIET